MQKILKTIILCSLIFCFVFANATYAKAPTTQDKTVTIASNDALDFMVRS